MSNSCFFLCLLICFGVFCLTQSRRAGGRGSRRRKTGVHRVFGPGHGSPEDIEALIASGHPHIVKRSHFHQQYKLGYKIVLICIAEGRPRPDFKWLKNKADMDYRQLNLHITEYLEDDHRIKARIEIDPATVGDQGLYECIADSEKGSDKRNFKVEYYV